jgi:copper chaperone CopZ
MTKQRFQLQGMHCVGCAMTVEGALEDLPGVASAMANYARQFADVEFDEHKVTKMQIVEAIQAAGYRVVLDDSS